MTLQVNTDDWLMIHRDDVEFILAALSHFGEWGFSPLDFERVRQARDKLEHGLVTLDGEPVKNAKFADLKGVKT
jgi:hypothetical protein